MLSAMGATRASIRSRCIRWLIGAADAALRGIHGVTEFESEAEGLLRVKIGRADREVHLSDGTHIHPGDAVMEIHLWNEQLLPVPGSGRNLGWTMRIRRRGFASLRRLALHIREDRRLEDIRALCMNPALASRRPLSALTRLLLRIGFEPVTSARPAPGYVLRFLDNIWLWLLTWAHNPEALRGRWFNHTRCEFWISRARFIALYSDGTGSTVPVAKRDRSRDAVAAPEVNDD